MKLHFVGIGGIGMSALAAMCRDLGHQVSGSDRGADKAENRHIFDKLRRQEIAIYPQDGSFFAACPDVDFLVYSSAIEADNPDFVSAKDCPRLHRAELLEKLLEQRAQKQQIIAVSGSCGKTSVTAYLAEALLNLNADPCCLDGGLVKRFISDDQPGNYRPGQGRFLVFEADESDQSLLRYHPDYALLLNIGTDHYSREELIRVFGTFLGQVKKGAVLSRDVYEAIRSAGMLPEKLPVKIFSAEKSDAYAVSDYQLVEKGHCRQAEVELIPWGRLTLPQCGHHNALNALAVGAMLEFLNFSAADILAALTRFDGVCRRSDFSGVTSSGGAVYDDYAHNPEKILSCLMGMREISVSGRLFAVFQPHGYGPFGFMQETLFKYLESFLTPADRFLLLEPYYAGGTSSFSPHSRDVAELWRQKSTHPECYLFCPDRRAVKDYLQGCVGPGDVIAVMGARDNSLNDFARQLAREL